MIKKDETTYVTRDLWLSASLVALKFQKINVDYQLEGNRLVGYFMFEKTPELDKTIDKYWNGELSIEPKEFKNILQGLKSTVASVYKSPHTNVEDFKE